MVDKSVNPWKTLKSEIVYKNKWYSVRRDEVITPSGKPGEYNVVQEPDAVFVAAIDSDNNLHLVGTYRYTTDMYSLEVPAGNSDGEEPLKAAKRELKEETGLIADEWTSLGRFQLENGKAGSFGHVFLAQKLTLTQDNDQEAEGIKEVRKVSFAVALTMIKDGRITDCQSIATITYAALFLKIDLS